MAKYQPYWGYGCAHPWIWYGVWPRVPKRVRTRNGWRHPFTDNDLWRRHQAPWKRSDKDSIHSVYEKKRVHRIFRRRAKLAIYRELMGDDHVLHNFRVSGNYLD
jgi:hypothetical protein